MAQKSKHLLGLVSVKKQNEEDCIMSFKKITVVALLVMGVVSSIFANASQCDKEATENKKVTKCKDNAVKHAKTPIGQSACPVAIWAAEVIGPNGEVLDEEVVIWETADGNYWVAKKIKPADEKAPHAVKTKTGAVMAPMTKDEAKNDTAKPEINVVKKAAPCPTTIKDCKAKEHTKSVNGKATVCSKADTKEAKATPAPVADEVLEDAEFIVIAD